MRPGPKIPKDILDIAVARRAPHLANRRLDAWRVLNGPGDGAPPGLTLDRYGAYAVLGARSAVPKDVVEAYVDAAAHRLGPEGIVVKRLSPRVAEGTSRVARGAVPDGPVPMHEEDAVLLCHLNEGLQTGLFLDHRETRLHCRRYAKGVEVLNLFAYTCAFSVHAALAGASRVTSVDVAKRALRRGRENMEASGCAPDTHRWFSDDVLAHLRRGPPRQYGLVVCDPPVMGRAKKRTFSLLADLDTLVAGAVRKVADGGVLVLSTHATALDHEALAAAAERAAGADGRRARVLAKLGLPEWDHPVDPEAGAGDADRGAYLTTLVLRVA